MSWPPVYDAHYRPAPDEPYWLRAEETMPLEEREALILAKLRAQVSYCWERSAFYREKWQRAGFHPDKLKTLDDLSRIPFLTKDEIRLEQEAHPPFGRYLCASPETLARMHGTSGTTGKPTVFAIDHGDWERIAHAHARIMWGFGVRPSDIVFIGSLFSLYVGSWGALVGTERLGATAFPFGAGLAGQTERAVEWLARVKPTVFYGTPSYALYLAETARKLGVEPRRDFAFRILFFSGEPGAGVPATRRRIEEAFGGSCIDTGSMAEMTPWMTNGECSERQGMHLWQDIVHAELVGKDSGERVPYGEEGVPVYTHLERTSQPMIRYLSGDLARWTDEPCPCGRTYPRLPLGIYGRADDMFIVRGVNIYPAAVENVLRVFPELGEEYRLIISREEEMDTLLVQVEPAAPLEDEAAQALRERVELALRKAIGVAAKVAVVPSGTLERTEFKARRVIDKRKLYTELRR
jgi:phenylacetate-CoA ligase